MVGSAALHQTALRAYRRPIGVSPLPCGTGYTPPVIFSFLSLARYACSSSPFRECACG